MKKFILTLLVITGLFAEDKSNYFVDGFYLDSHQQ